MDEFEKEYRDKVMKLTDGFQNRRRELAISRIQMFAAAICRQIVDLKQNFDVIVGGGNSGLFMTAITEMIYAYLHVPLPPIVNLPIYRFEAGDQPPLFDNTSLLPSVRQSLEKIKKINKILFVDDETMRALTENICFQLMLDAITDINHLDVTIISENHFFEWHYDLPKVSVKFFAYARCIWGLNGNIGYFIPEELFKTLSAKNESIVSYNHAMAAIIAGGLKTKDTNGTPLFDFTVEKNLNDAGTDYKHQKSMLLSKLKNILGEGIEKYKKKEIVFRF